MFRHIYSNVSSLDGSAEGYAAPMLRADAGIILFGFLTAGVMGWLEFAPDVLVSPNFTAAGLDPTLAGELSNAVGDVTVFQGNQAFIGLFAGLYMGN